MVTCYIVSIKVLVENGGAYTGVPGGSGSETGWVGTGCISGGGVCE